MQKDRRGYLTRGEKEGAIQKENVEKQLRLVLQDRGLELGTDEVEAFVAFVFNEIVTMQAFERNNGASIT